LSVLNGAGIDAFFFSLHLAGISSILGSINFIATVYSGVGSMGMVKSIRSGGFSCSLFPWSIFFTSLLLIISLPVLAACITMVIYDRHFNSSFFDPFRGGDVILFQHLFWFFGHPEVYILILPAFGLISEILGKYVQCWIFGRDSMFIALLLIGVLGCVVWGHHMFVVGFDVDTRAYFSSATSIIAIPTGIKLFNWFHSLYGAVAFFLSSLFFVIGFLFSFAFGGVTGIILANSFIDTLLHDSYFVVGHFHYVLSLGAVYSVFAAFFAYFALFGLDVLEAIGRVAFIVFFVSSNLVFFNMHSLGLVGLPRRIFDFRVAVLRFH
jgi:heme/copper-type cytochrome/quinol oxidase subunit 1